MTVRNEVFACVGRAAQPRAKANINNLSTGVYILKHFMFLTEYF